MWQQGGLLRHFLETTLPITYCTVYKFDNMKESDSPESLGHRWLSIAPARVCFCSLFLLSPLSYCRATSFVIALPPRPFKQGCDEYNDGGTDALYHHLVLALYEWVPHYHEILINPLYPSLSSPTLIHAMRLTNPMICLIIWSQIWALREREAEGRGR